MNVREGIHKFKVLVTGGAGFIGSHLVRLLVHSGFDVLNIDALKTGGSKRNNQDIRSCDNYQFLQIDLLDFEQTDTVLRRFRPDAIVHLAAESHVDRSIHAPIEFARNNVVGTVNLLEAARGYLFDTERRDPFRLIHISTDEVFGELDEKQQPFNPDSPVRPHSPYSASKASSDHFVSAFARTYGLPTVISHCTNNYGPAQHPEKLIPNTIRCALSGKEIPLYGSGLNIRDWIHVQDHVRGIVSLLNCAQLPLERYTIGARMPVTNKQLVEWICTHLDRISPRPDGVSYSDQIRFVDDRPGHDWRYEVDPSLITLHTGWLPEIPFEVGLESTIRWYLAHEDWIREMTGYQR